MKDGAGAVGGVGGAGKGGVKGGAGAGAGAGQGGRGRVATNQYSVTEYFGVSKAGGS